MMCMVKQGDQKTDRKNVQGASAVKKDAAGSISVEEQQASGGRYYRVSGI